MAKVNVFNVVKNSCEELYACFMGRNGINVLSPKCGLDMSWQFHAVCDIIVDENYFHWQALEQPARPPGQAGQNGKVSK